MATTEMTKIYELVLNGPGMSEEFKISFPVTKKHLLLICLLVENGIQQGKGKGEDLAGLVTKETASELAVIIPEILKKGGQGLFEFYEKLKQF